MAKSYFRPLIATITSTESRKFLMMLRGKYLAIKGTSVDIQSDDKKIAEAMENMKKIAEANDPGKAAKNAENTCRLMQDVEQFVNQQIVPNLSVPQCRTAREISDALLSHIFRFNDFDTALESAVEYLVQLENPPNSLAGKSFTPASFVRSFQSVSPPHQVVGEVGESVDYDGEFASAEVEFGVLYESVQFSLAVSPIDIHGRRTLICEAESDEFSAEALSDALGKATEATRVLMRSVQLSEGDPDLTKQLPDIPANSVNAVIAGSPFLWKSMWAQHPENMKSISKRVSLAVKYLQQADSAVEPSLKLVLSVVSLESMLCDEKSGIANAVSKRASTILSNNLELREKYFRALKKMYDKRSRFLHGVDAGLEIKDLATVARSTAGSVLIRITLWLEFMNRVDLATDSSKELFKNIDNAHSTKNRMIGIDADDSIDPCPLLWGFVS
jgi:hypothetical protein